MNCAICNKSLIFLREDDKSQSYSKACFNGSNSKIHYIIDKNYNSIIESFRIDKFFIQKNHSINETIFCCNKNLYRYNTLLSLEEINNKIEKLRHFL